MKQNKIKNAFFIDCQLPHFCQKFQNRFFTNGNYNAESKNFFCRAFKCLLSAAAKTTLSIISESKWPIRRTCPLCIRALKSDTLLTKSAEQSMNESCSRKAKFEAQIFNCVSTPFLEYGLELIVTRPT